MFGMHDIGHNCNDFISHVTNLIKDSVNQLQMNDCISYWIYWGNEASIPREGLNSEISVMLSSLVTDPGHNSLTALLFSEQMDLIVCNT